LDSLGGVHAFSYNSAESEPICSVVQDTFKKYLEDNIFIDFKAVSLIAGNKGSESANKLRASETEITISMKSAADETPKCNVDETVR